MFFVYHHHQSLMSSDGSSPASFRLSLPRLDQDPLNFTDDFSEILSVISSSDSDISDLLAPEHDNGEYREIGGRLFSKQNPMYFLPIGATFYTTLACSFS
jgi:hypothetical protein